MFNAVVSADFEFVTGNEYVYYILHCFSGLMTRHCDCTLWINIYLGHFPLWLLNVWHQWSCFPLFKFHHIFLLVIEPGYPIFIFREKNCWGSVPKPSPAVWVQFQRKIGKYLSLLPTFIDRWWEIWDLNNVFCEGLIFWFRLAFTGPHSSYS